MFRRRASPSPPLGGIRVLDFTRYLAGPYCTALLADLGASVVKVEAPDGDPFRFSGPVRDGESALFVLLNRGKMGVSVDLTSPRGRAAVLRLARKADIVVENFRPGVAERLGVDPATVRRLNPKAIYACISGFGRRAANRDAPALDIVVQALSGFMDLNGEPEGPPMKIGESIADIIAGLYAASAIQTALFARERGAGGADLDIAMSDALLSVMVTPLAQWMLDRDPPRRTGARHPFSTPFGPFRAADRHLAIAVVSDAQFARLAHAIDRPELADDPRFATEPARKENEDALLAAIDAWLAKRTAADAAAALSAAGVPAAVVAAAGDALEEGLANSPALELSRHPRLGELPLPAHPVRLAALAATTIGAGAAAR